MDLASPTHSTSPSAPPALPPDAAPADAPLGLGDRFVVIAFLFGVGLFGFISVADLLANLFR
jgi:hypothetical protein